LEEINYEQDVAIDSNALDLEWLNQPELMRKYAKHMADAKKELDEAKERLDVGKARIETDIRANPEKHNMAKSTEAAIQSAIILQPEYQKLAREYSDAKYEYEVAGAVVRAIDQRKTALENLVRLLGLSYFAGPQSPRDLEQEKLAEKSRKMENQKVKIQQRRKKRE